MDDWLLGVIKAAGYLGVALLMILENVIPAIPSELILPFAGYLAATGELHPFGVIAAGSAGSTLGASSWYVLGRVWGRQRMLDFVGRYGRWLLLDVDDVTRAERWFVRHRRRATFFGRLIPAVRSLISVPAGISHMPAGIFLLYTIAGTVLWTTALTFAGYLLRDAYDRVRDVVGPVATIVIGLGIAVLVVRYVRRQCA